MATEKTSGPDTSGSQSQGPDEATRRQFKEALDRKRHKGSANAAGGGEDQSGKLHDAHGPAKAQRTFRRKSGG
jgi:hypothetical protein